MRTLYIPTTTLNFNNIFSSESISPSAFYGRREFGYKNWHKIEENPFDNSILLYDKMPMVNRPASDYDDYPLVFAVSVSDETMEGMREVSSGVFQYDSTIYLNPYSTAIFFATDNHKRIAISKSESSAETKMIRLYQNRMLVAKLGDFVNISNLQDTELNAKAIEDDKRINRMKGLLYGYFIGAALSMNSKDVEKLNILNEIKNIFAAILASLNGRATQEQVNQLQVLFKRLERFDPKRLELEKILADGETSNEEKVDRIMTLFERYAYDYSKPNFYQLVNEIQAGRPEYGDNKAIAWVNQAISNLLSTSKKNKALLQPKDGEIYLSRSSLTVLNTSLVKDDIPNALFRAFINEVFSLEEFNGKISTFKQDLATAVTYKAKQIYGDDWNEKCLARNYLNDLRKHIGGAEFEHKWNSGVLSAVAAVILKGDDWEKLLDFLQSKGIADYRLTFAIYGTLNGFANLTRDFTDLILNESDGYVKDVYFFFYQQLFGENIEMFDVPTFERPVENTSLLSGIKQVMSKLPKKQRDTVATKIESAIEIEAKVGDVDAYLFILDNLTKGKVYNVLKEKLDRNSQKPLREQVTQLLPAIKGVKADTKKKALEALEIEEKVGDPTAFCYILDNVGVQPKIRKKFFDYFRIPSESQANTNSKLTNRTNRHEVQNIIFSQESTGHFLSDYDFIIHNKELVPVLEKCNPKWKDDLGWFIEAHNPKSKFTHYIGKPTDNKTVINQFVRLKNERYMQSLPILLRLYNIE